MSSTIKARRGPALAVAVAIALTTVMPAAVLAAPPPNDTVSGATIVAALPFQDTMAMSEADGGEMYSPCTGSANHTIFYRIPAPASTQRLTISTLGSDFDTVLDAWQVMPFGLAPVGCNNNDGALLTSRLTMMVGPGSDILIMVSSYGPVAGTAITSIELVPPPPNDDFDAASLVTAVPFTDALDTFYGTVAADDPVPSCGPSGVFSPTVWYAISLTTATQIVASTSGSDWDTRLSLWTGSRGSLTQVACADQTPQGSHQAVLYGPVAAETTAYLMIDFGQWSQPGGATHLTIDVAPPPPVNDEIANAMALAPLPFSVDMDTTQATASPDDPLDRCTGTAATATVWFTYTATTTEPILISGSANYGAYVNVYAGTPSSESWQRCIYIGGGSIRLEPSLGTTYYLMVGAGYGGQGGQLSLRADHAFRIDLSLATPLRVNPKTGVVTLTGTVDCSKPASTILGLGQLVQKVGRYTIRADISLYLPTCDGPTPFTTTLTGDSGPYVGGKAQVDLAATGLAYGTYEYATGEYHGLVNMKASK